MLITIGILLLSGNSVSGFMSTIFSAPAPRNIVNIINNSSVAGLRGMGRLSHYAASKWGLTGLTRSWAIELAQYGIRVNSIHPTGVNTPMNDGLAALEGLTPAEIAERSAGNLLPVPWIEPEDVAHAVLYLASDRARYVTGSPFVIDAGLLSR